MEKHSRWLYPVIGAVLGIAAMIGFVGLRASSGEPGPLAAHIETELIAQPVAYTYLLLWTALTLVGFGWMLGRREDTLWRASRTDPSTGLANRRLLQGELLRALRASITRQVPVALLVADVDGLKALNDVMGHAAGDAALRLVAESVRATCRASDLAVRWGGDEFVVLARGTSAAGAIELGERIRSTLRRLGAAPEYEGLPVVTVSIGVADVERAGSARPDLLFAAADRALYQAKATGRDRVMLAAPGWGPARAVAAPSMAQIAHRQGL